ncbi:hypothetical protein J6590_065776 [Homalodisca vitripennis]|nr:hypothetical protein J6590_065776 [Homalodisca vitripennis]
MNFKVAINATIRITHWKLDCGYRSESDCSGSTLQRSATRDCCTAITINPKLLLRNAAIAGRRHTVFVTGLIRLLCCFCPYQCCHRGGPHIAVRVGGDIITTPSETTCQN